ncbi:MAG: 2-phospho-L-lactate guanylyltransferase [Thermomicrobiales bacterium]
MNGAIAAIVPIRSLAGGKTRLAGVLTPSQRETLTRSMVQRVIAAALSSDAIASVIVVSEDPAALALARAVDPRVIGLAQDGSGHPGLLGALDQARAYADVRAVSGLLVLFGDLPLLDGDDVRHLVRRDAPVVVAPDRHGAGTNALLLRHTAADPGPNAFRFQFGEGSYARHVAEAHRLGFDVATSISAGTSFDLDTPDDLDLLREEPRVAAAMGPHAVAAVMVGRRAR